MATRKIPPICEYAAGLETLPSKQILSSLFFHRLQSLFGEQFIE